MHSESDDPDVILAKEYITTILNHKNGAIHDPEVDHVLPAVRAYLTFVACDTNSSDGNYTAPVGNWTSLLFEYNSGARVIDLMDKIYNFTGSSNNNNNNNNNNNTQPSQDAAPKPVQLSSSELFYLAIPIIIMAIIGFLLCCYSTIKWMCGKNGAKKISLRDLSGFSSSKQM